MPEISVIVPVYKVEPYIRRCVDSILAQTITDFELILIDDGSPDKSGFICDEYSLKDCRVHVIHQENQGQAAARNHALDWVFSNSDSGFISFIDSDDWVHPQYLELLLEGIHRYNVRISQCRYLETDGRDEFQEATGMLSCITPEEQYLEHYSSSMWDKLFARSCWESVRFPEGQIYEDLAICYKLLFKESKIALVNDVLYYYRKNPESTVHREWNPAMLARMNAWDAQIGFFKNHDYSSVFPRTVDYYCRIAGEEYVSIRKSKSITAIERSWYSAVMLAKLRRMLRYYKRYYGANKYYLFYYELSCPIKTWLVNKYAKIQKSI